MPDQKTLLDIATWLLTLLLGAFFSLAFVLLVEKARKPHLRIQVERDHPQLADGRKFLRLEVHNEKINPLLGWFIARHPALACRATVQFLRENNTPVFAADRRMIGRWANSPEPVVPQLLVDPQGNLVVAAIRDLTKSTDFIDIPPGENELLDVVMRVPNEQVCHGWHNRLIQNPSLPDEHRFDMARGRYHVLVRVRTSGQEFRGRFRLVNDFESIREFRLEDVSRKI